MIYLDYQATTPLAPEAREAMLPWLGGPDTAGFANPHSPHRPGRAAAAAVEVAREQVAALFPAGGRVIFTSGATEAINLAIKGSLRGDGGTLAVSAIEHAAVLDCADAMRGALDVERLPVGRDGIVAADADLPADTRLLAVMQVNNEIGTIQPVDALARRAKALGALTLCDAVQGAGKIAAPQSADLIAISAHKLYGPKGIGALWIRDGVELVPVQHGGGQEQGLRSGTLSPALCAGFGTAASLALERQSVDEAHIRALWNRACEILARWSLNGSAQARWPGNLNLRLDGLDVGRLMSDVRDVAFSAGSACASGSGRSSHVLTALGLTPAQAKSSVRLGFGRYTNVNELEDACARLDNAASAQGV
ncbi:cysteine desulfurase family protein [Novosphingobium aquimarinum]|uniref:cysteine desulfurase family protein n=1 Tax=Novosphingobium aquimarinum TaxID=2682494 RepID=UPI0012EC638F|nr:cysteine desulfurase family protein [Novosphingobium aquimarinum]